MSDDRKAIFFLNHNNDVDHIVPIIYKLGKRSSVSIDAVLWYDSVDYRINVIKTLEDVTVQPSGSPGTEPAAFRDKLVERAKDLGRALPSNVPERLYSRVMKEFDSTDSTPLTELIEDLAEGYEDVLVGLEWTLAKKKREQMSDFKDRKKFTTVVLPHGDAPYQNAMEQQELHFESLLEEKDAFVKRANLDEIARRPLHGNISSAYNYHVMPNETVARRIRPFTEEERVKILGSPRYNQEWLDVVSGHRPDYQLPSTDRLNIVMFNRSDEKYNVSKKEVENTIRLVTRFPDVHLIVKEHPRRNLIDSSSEVTDIPNLEIKRDEVQSVSLVDWGDVFLEVGTTIAFEPIMRDKPVFSLSYTHSNYATIAHYFSNSDMRCKDDLYHAIHDLIEEGCSDFYDEEERERFIREMITSGQDSVLDAHADFIESCLDVDKKETQVS